ncbi:MAG: transporter [Hyphomicrobiales bacterium]|nr:transporter [Hyphomicrobiales bacterium]
MTAVEANAVSPERQDGLSNPKRTLAFLTVSLGITMAVLDGTIVNVALPTIAGDQHANAADAIWIVTSYQLAVMVSLLPMAALAEAIGFRKVFSGGLLVFAIASLLCAYSNSLLTLTLARILQGIGGAALMGISTALLRHILPHRVLGRGLSSMAVVVAVAGAAGPTIAAAILAVASWHWLFLINVPLGVIGLAVGRLTLPETPRNGVSFDYISAVLNVGAFGFLLSGLTGIGGTQFPLWLSIMQIIAGLIAMYFLAVRQIPRKAPMFPIDLLQIPAFRLSIIASVSSFVAQFLAVVSLPFFFARALSYTEVETGLLMTPWPVATAVIAPIAGRLADRFSGGRVSGLGSLLLALGLVSAALLPDHPAVWDIGWRLALCGIGFGLFQSPNNRVMITSAPRERAGGASGMLSTARLFGQSIGAALAAIIFGLTAGYNLPLTMGIAAAFAFLASLVSIWR